MAEKLEIVVDTARAIKSLDDMGNASDRLIATLGKLNNVPGVDKLINSLQSVNKVDLSGLTKAVDGAQKSFDKLDPSKLAGVATAARAANGASGDFNGMATAIRNSVAEIGGLTASAATMVGGLFRGADASVSLTQRLGDLLGVTPKVAGAMLALGSIVIFKQVLDQVAQFAEALNEPTQQVTRLYAALGKTDGVAGLEKLRDIAKSTGGSIETMINPFTKFSVVAKQAGISVQGSAEIFGGFQTALTGAGASAEQASRVFNALQQMMSKGTVQMEELKNQLGDSLPGALDGAAKAMGVTTKELIKMVETGKVLAVDLLPRFADQMRQTWSDAAQAQIKSFVGQMNIFKNAIWETTLAFGSGGLVGASAGFASALAAINGALMMPGVKEFAALIGDLVGVLSMAAGIIVGDFLRGLMLIPSAIGTIYGSMVSLLKSFGEFIGTGSTFFTVMNAIGGALSFVAGAIPTLIGAFIGYKVAVAAATGVTVLFGAAKRTAAALMGTVSVAANGMRAGVLSASTAVNAMTASLTGSSMAMTSARAGMLGLATGATATGVASASAATGVTALTAAISRLLGPLSLIAAAATLGYMALDKLGVVDKVWAAFKGSEAAVAASKDLDAFGSAAQRITDQVAKKSFATIFETATAFDTYAEKVERAKLANEQYELQEIKNTAAMQRAKAVIDERVAREKSYQTTIKSSSDAIKGRIESETAAAKATKEASKSAEGVIAQARAEGQARGVASLAADNHKTKLQGLNAALKENDSAMMSSTNFIANLEAAHKANAAAAEIDKISHEESAKIQKIFGVTLSESQLSLANYAMGMGKSAEEAAKMAVGLDRLLRTNEEWTKMLDEEIVKQDRKIANGNTLLGLIQQEIRALNEKKASEQGLSDLEAVRLTRLQAQEQTMKGMVQGLIETKLAQEVLNESIRNGGNMTQAAITVMGQYKDQLGQTATVEQLVAAADKRKTEEINKMVGATEKAAGVTKSANDVVKQQGDTAAKTSEDVKKLAVSYESLAAPADKVRAGVPIISAALEKLQAPVNSLAITIPAIAQAFEQIGNAAATAPANLTALQATLPPLNEAFIVLTPLLAQAGTDFTTFSLAAANSLSSLTALTSVVPALAEPLSSLADAVGKLGETGTSLTLAAEGIAKFVEGLTPALASVTAVGEAITKADEAVKALDATVKANSALFSPLESSIDSLITKIDAAISKFNDMAEAARRAASASSSGGGGGGSSVTTGGQRYGGYSGGAMESVVSSAASFANAPKLANGIANTNSIVKRTGGSGIPTILHPNEAVVPLPKGRSIPVDLNMGGGEALNGIVGSLANVVDFMAEAAKRGVDVRNDGAMAEKSVSTTSERNASSTGMRESAAVRESMYGGTRRSAGTASNSSADTEKVTITFNVTAKDADSFRRSEQQISADMYKALRKASKAAK